MTWKRRLFLPFLIFLAALSGSAQTEGDQYTSVRNTLRRKGGGDYEIVVANTFKYVGLKHFHIRQAADAEQHIFVDADTAGRLKRLVWVQFEQQLPGQTWQYDYPSPDRTKLGELEFITDSGAFRSYKAQPTSADHMKLDELLAEHKLRFDGPVIAIRMVHLPDKERRRELMIIYAEPMPKAELTKFREEEDDAARWPKELAKVKADAARDISVKLKP